MHVLVDWHVASVRRGAIAREMPCLSDWRKRLHCCFRIQETHRKPGAPSAKETSVNSDMVAFGRYKHRPWPRFIRSLSRSMAMQRP